MEGHYALRGALRRPLDTGLGSARQGGPPPPGDHGLCLPEEALGSQPSCPFSLVHPLGTMPRSVQETGPCTSDE